MPAGAPRPIADKMHTALHRPYKTASGLGYADVSIDQFTKQVHDEYMKWGRLVKSNNIKIE